MTLHRLPPSDDGRPGRATGLLAIVVVVALAVGIWLVSGRDPGSSTGEPEPDRPCASGAFMFTTVSLSELPPEASETVDLIDAGGPFPYEEDGDVFGNREGNLPECEDGYYHEYTVETPGSDDRGARRIVADGSGWLYWTDDHYASFSLVER